MEEERKRAYPQPCPVCRAAMIGEKTVPDLPDYDRYQCLNCGTVVIEEDLPDPQ